MIDPLTYNKVSELRYSPWGETRDTIGTPTTDRKYTGQREEAALGLYYYNARWYDPALGRFTQPDTIIPGAGNPMAWDRYMYVNNNPVNGTDPTGHWPNFPNIDFRFSTNVIGNLYDSVGNMVGIDNASQLVSDGLALVGLGLDCLAGATDVAATAIVATSTVVGATSGAAITLPGGGTAVVSGAAGASVGWATGELAVQPIIAVGNVLASVATVYNTTADFVSGKNEINISVVGDQNQLEVTSSLTVSPSTQLGLATTGLGWAAPLALPSTLLQLGAVAGDLGINAIKQSAHFDQRLSIKKDRDYYYDAHIYYAPE